MENINPIHNGLNNTTPQLQDFEINTDPAVKKDFYSKQEQNRAEIVREMMNIQINVPDLKLVDSKAPGTRKYTIERILFEQNTTEILTEFTTNDVNLACDRFVQAYIESPSTDLIIVDHTEQPRTVGNVEKGDGTKPDSIYFVDTTKHTLKIILMTGFC